MITSHLIQTNHTLKNDAGSELYIEIEHDSGKSSIYYKATKDGSKSVLEVDNLQDLVDMLNEAAKLLNPAVG
jgi:hypothetical protein